MPAWLAPVVGSVIAGAAGFAGARSQNKFNKREAAKNRQFQERMRNTQWQAAVEDMRTAGLNPALAYQQGPNAAPGGSQASSAENPVTSGLSAAQSAANLRIMRQTERKIGAEAKETEARATLAQDRTNYLTRRFEANGYRSAPLLHDMLDMEMDGLRLGLEGTRIRNARDAELRDISRVGGDLARTFGMWGPVLGSLAAPGGLGVSSAKGLTNYLRRRAAMRAVRNQRR